MPAAAAAAPPGRPHAVVVPWPGQGHINPLLHLSRRLIHEGGYMVTFVNTQHNHERVLRSQQQESTHNTADDSTSTDGGLRFVSIPDGMPDESERMAEIPELCRCIQKVMAPEFEKLVGGLMRGPHPVTLILSDVFVLHTQDAANKYGIPRVGFWTQSAASFVIHLYCARGYRAPPEAYEGIRAITDIPGCPPLSQTEMLTFLQPYDPSDFMFRFWTEPFLRFNESKAVLLNTFEELERECMASLVQKEELGTKVYSIGPILPPAFFTPEGMRTKSSSTTTAALWKENYECLEWLDGKEKGSVVYVAFGSITVLKKEVVEEFAHALEESGVAFLWVLRPGMVEGGEMEMPEGWWERVGERGKVIKWAPQLHVLTHPSVGAFLTHAGWNSTLEGIAAGLPMLGFPYFTDQMLNCRCIEDLWGIGRGLEPDANGLVHRDTIRGHLLHVTTHPKILANARRLHEAARLSVTTHASSKSSRSSLSNLTTFIDRSLTFI